ncbi:hypothetical protein BDP55DRAFT_391193 [Colletotrichum godetiae]|uniref:Uncharacterized protein n=1 Tax=Colletotrichum godetiae TaxID=1209918 RepID=A0AAJ0ACV7_9PEZI|nr:uncharacterized protein BDP55DRAFT_391193 [Colletotrichum godetiae]KAK1658585.1 hypothetical protein BDP55DRAFT_391193 [Colletotrichum godetiae]
MPTDVNKMALYRGTGIAVSAAAAVVAGICGVVATVTGTTTREVDMEGGSAATGRAHRLRGIATRGTEARSVGPLETATSLEIAVSAVEHLAAVATKSALRLRRLSPHGHAAPNASETRVVAHPHLPPDELVENVAYPAPGLQEIDRCRPEGVRVTIANHEGRGDRREALRRPQHRPINEQLQSAADTHPHGVVHQFAIDDPTVEARVQSHLEVPDLAVVALRVEPLGDVRVRDLEAARGIVTVVASPALQIPAVAVRRLMTRMRPTKRAEEAREGMRQKEAVDASHSFAPLRSADHVKRCIIARSSSGDHEGRIPQQKEK